MIEIHVKGLSDLQKFLDQLPVKMEKNIVRGALRAGAKLVEAQAKQNAPIGPVSPTNARLHGSYAGAMRDSIHITSNVRGGRVTASVKVGGKNKKTQADVWYAHMIEFTGARPHDIKAKKAISLFIAGIFGKIVHHPGFKAHAFMRPALDGQAQSAIVAAGNYIKNRLATKEGLDTAGILVEGDT